MSTLRFRPSLGRYASSHVARTAICERPGRVNEDLLRRVREAREWRKDYDERPRVDRVGLFLGRYGDRLSRDVFWTLAGGCVGLLVARWFTS